MWLFFPCALQIQAITPPKLTAENLGDWRHYRFHASQQRAPVFIWDLLLEAVFCGSLPTAPHLPPGILIYHRLEPTGCRHRICRPSLRVSCFLWNPKPAKIQRHWPRQQRTFVHSLAFTGAALQHVVLRTDRHDLHDLRC